MIDDKDAALRAEAGQLLASGLSQILNDYGAWKIIGSYTLRLMVWRDLDIVVEMHSIDRSAFLSLGVRIAELLRPYKMFMTDYSAGPSEYDFKGLYWGIRLGDVHEGAWKIDIHAEEPARCKADD